MSLELLADQIVHDRLQRAAQAALIDLLPRRPRPPLPAATRQHLAAALRSLACRLDPCVTADSPLQADSVWRVANSR